MNAQPGAPKVALITGISGQDGAFLAQLLLRHNYRVVGTTRDTGVGNLANLDRLGVRQQIDVRQLDVLDFDGVAACLNVVRPTEIYHLSAQSSVARSFEQPRETFLSCVDSTANVLEAARQLPTPPRIFNATSSEVFGDTSQSGFNETAPLQPRSPYGVAKASAHMLVANYRESYELFCCSGILFNHESELRPARYVTRKIVDGARRIAKGGREPLVLGSLDIVRDWGLAREYVEAMWLMLQRPVPADYVIATGQAASLQDFLDLAFQRFGLRWTDYVRLDPTLARPRDIRFSVGDATKAEQELGWKARSGVREVIESLLSAQAPGLSAATPPA